MSESRKWKYADYDKEQGFYIGWDCWTKRHHWLHESRYSKKRLLQLKLDFDRRIYEKVKKYLGID